jgi:hypothetical protein
MLRKVFFVLMSLLVGFGSGILLAFMTGFTYTVLRHGGLW